jgi:uncharacterized protein (TIRG00374 family)
MSDTHATESAQTVNLNPPGGEIRWGWKGFLLGLLLFALLIYIGGIEALKTNLEPNLLLLALFFLVNGFMFYVAAYRWQFILKQLKKDAPGSMVDYFFYFMSGTFASIYIPKWGSDFLVRPNVLKRLDGVPLKTAMLSVLVEKNLNLLPVLMFIGPALLGIFKVFSFFQVFILSSIIFCLTLYFFTYKTHTFVSILTAIFKGILNISGKLPLLKRWVKQDYYERVEKLGSFKLLVRKSLFVLLILTMLRFGLMLLRLFILVAALSLNHIGLPDLFYALPFSLFAVLLSITPGSLGIVEGGFYGVFAYLKIPNTEIVAFLIARRLYHILVSMIYFFISYAAITIRMNRRRFILATKTQRHKEKINAQKNDQQ